MVNNHSLGTISHPSLIIVKMFKHYFEQIQNIGVFPVISLLIFFSFFVILLVWLTRLDKKHISDMRHLPLEVDAPIQPGKASGTGKTSRKASRIEKKRLPENQTR